MVTRKTAGKKDAGKLKLKKETLRDLDARGKVKGGGAVATRDSCGCRATTAGGDGGTTALPPPYIAPQPTK